MGSPRKIRSRPCEFCGVIIVFTQRGKPAKWCKTCVPNGFWSIAWKYGISHPQHQAMIKACNNRCEICGCPPPGRNKNDSRLCIDHCHRTGKVRGLLCHTCNQMLGFFDNHGDRVEKLLKYRRQRSTT